MLILRFLAEKDAASVISYASTSSLVKSKDDKKKDEIDVKKLQEQAMRSSIKFHM